MPDHDSLALHQQLAGKIEIVPKIKVTDKQTLALVYTPGVGEACEAIAQDSNKSYELTGRGKTVAIISDGTAVLGLGNIGPEAAMPVMEGKSLIFKEFAGINGYPLCLKRQSIEEFINTIIALEPTFAGINLEDIKAPDCFVIEQTLTERLNIPVFHDDQHGTAIVVLAGLINAAKVLNVELKNQTVVINGAGAAGTAIAKLLLSYGLTNILVCDTKGIITPERADLNNFKQELATITNTNILSGDLAAALTGAKILIGVSGPNTVTTEMIKLMAPDPIVFALANPIPEIMPNTAKEGGAAIVATGRSDFPNQINNALVFPGFFQGLLKYKIKKVTMDLKLKAATALAGLITEPTADNLIPSLFDKRVVTAVSDSLNPNF